MSVPHMPVAPYAMSVPHMPVAPYAMSAGSTRLPCRHRPLFSSRPRSLPRSNPRLRPPLYPASVPDIKRSIIPEISTACCIPEA
eukprot:3753894-Rhodomonas_salina.1